MKDVCFLMLAKLIFGLSFNNGFHNLSHKSVPDLVYFDNVDVYFFN